MSSECFIVAIDGPAGAGKSTTARAVAERLALSYLDSGALYRAVALAALDSDVSLDDGVAVARVAAGLQVDLDAANNRVRLDGRDVSSEIRTSRVSQAASKVSAHPEVRQALVALQRAAARPPGTVAEGRDIGTVIFPEADLKVFLDADPRERARRRSEEMQGASSAERVRDVEREMAERDRRDATRAVAPLQAAADALVIDSSHLAIDEVVECIVKEAERRRSAG